MAEAFNSQGQANWYWVDTIESTAAPTAAEINAGVQLGCGIRTITSPTTSPATVDATPLCATTERTVRGLATRTNASLTLLRGDTSTDDNYALMNTMKGNVGDTGYLVHALRGSLNTDGEVVAGDVVDVYPSFVSVVGSNDVSPGQAATWKIDFTHPEDAVENVVVAGA